MTRCPAVYLCCFFQSSRSLIDLRLLHNAASTSLVAFLRFCFFLSVKFFWKISVVIITFRISVEKTWSADDHGESKLRDLWKNFCIFILVLFYMCLWGRDVWMWLMSVRMTNRCLLDLACVITVYSIKLYGWPVYYKENEYTILLQKNLKKFDYKKWTSLFDVCIAYLTA